MFSDSKIFMPLCHAVKIAEQLGDKDLVDATEDGIKDLVAWVERRDLTEWTKTDYRGIIKRFFKWENGGEYPEKVEWVSTTYSGNEKKLPEKLITEEDVEKLMKTLEPRFFLTGRINNLQVNRYKETVVINVGYGKNGDFVIVDTGRDRVELYEEWERCLKTISID